MYLHIKRFQLLSGFFWKDHLFMSDIIENENTNRLIRTSLSKSITFADIKIKLT